MLTKSIILYIPWSAYHPLIQYYAVSIALAMYKIMSNSWVSWKIFGNNRNSITSFPSCLRIPIYMRQVIDTTYMHKLTKKKKSTVCKGIIISITIKEITAHPTTSTSAPIFKIEKNYYLIFGTAWAKRKSAHPTDTREIPPCLDDF